MKLKNSSSTSKRIICYLLACAMATPTATLAAPPAPAPTPASHSPAPGQAIPNLTTAAGNTVYMVSEEGGRTRVMAVEYGQIVEGSLEKGRVVWDTTLPTEIQRTGNANERPSRLPGLLGWGSGGASQEVRQDIHDVQSGKAQPTSLGQKVKGGAIYLGQGAAYFYLALGLVSAVQVLMFHSSNPMAVKRYMDTLTDPVGYAALAGFMIAAYPFFRSMAKPKNAPLHRYLPRFAAGLVVGGLVSSFIAEMGRDPNVRACMNLDKIPQITAGSVPERDLNACDRAFDKWTEPTVIADKMAPHIGTILAAGGLYWGSSYLLAKARIPAMLMGMKLPKFGAIRGGTWMSTVAVQVGHLMLFLGAYHVAKNMLGIEDGIREQLLMRYSFQKNEMGATLTQSFNNLAFHLSQLEKSNFTDPDYAIKTSLQQTHLASQLFAWRMLQLQPTKYAADQWVEKLTTFQDTLNKSYEFYEDVLKRIAYERANPAAPEDDPSRLSMDYLTSNYFTNPKLGFIGRFDDPDDWEFVKSRNLGEYVLGSMACGPEVQYPFQERPWSPLTNLVFNRAPKAGTVINNTGRADEFRPPMVTALNREERICNQNVLGLTIKQGALDYQVVAVVTGPDGKTPVQVQEKSLLEYIRKNIRPDIIGPDHQLHFDAWWTKHVLSEVRPTYDRYEKQYASIINGPLKKALTRDDYNCLSGAKNLFTQGGGPKSLQGSFTSAKCPKPAERSLAKGIINSLRDEKNSYFAMIRGLPQIQSDKALSPQFNVAINAVDAHVEAGLKGLAENLGKPVDVNAMKNQLLELNKKVNDLFPQPPKLSAEQLEAGIQKFIATLKAERAEMEKKRTSAPSASAAASAASSPALAASSPALAASAAQATAGQYQIAGKVGTLEELFSAPDIRAELEKAVQSDANMDFFIKNPYLALLRQNLSHIDSVYEQIRLLHSYGAIPDKSGPAFLGN